MITVFWLEVRRSPLRWWFPAMALVVIGMLFGRSTEWLGSWPETSIAAQLPAVLISPMVAAGAAWSAGRSHRLPGVGAAGEPASLGGRASRQAEAVHLAASAAYGLLAMAFSLLVAGTATVIDGRAGEGGPWFGYVGLGVLHLGLAAVFGHLVGRLWPSKFAPVVAGFAQYASTALLENTPYGALSLLSAPIYVDVNPAALAVRAVLVGVLGVIAVTLAGRPYRTGARWRSQVILVRAGCGLLAAGLVVALLRGVGGPLLVLRPVPPAGAMLCSSARPVVCLWPEHAKYLPEAQRVARRLAEAARDGLVLPEAFYERGLRRQEEAGNPLLPRVEGETGQPLLFDGFLVTLGPSAIAADMVFAALSPTLRKCPDSDEEVHRTVWFVTESLRTRAADPAGRTPDDRSAALRRAFDVLKRSCHA